MAKEVKSSTKPKTSITSDERGLSTWLFWAILLCSGLLVWAISSAQVKKRDGSVSQTVNIATRLQSTASAMNAEAVLAAFGNAGSLDRMNQMRQNLQSDIALLRSGGYDNPGDKHPALAMGGRSDIPLASVATDMATFNSAVQPMLGAYDVLSKAAVAETELSSVILKLRQTSNIINSSRVLTNGAWGSALMAIRSDFTRRELDSMGAVFTPSEGGKLLAKQWADIFAARAREAKTLADIAPKDSSLSPSEKQLILDFSALATQLSEYTQTLLNTTDVRLRVRDSLGPVRSASEAMQKSTSNLVKSISKSAQGYSLLDYTLWTSMGLSFLGFLGVLRSLWVMGYERWRAQQDGLKGTNLYASLERATRELRKITSLETNSDKVSQPADSPIFPLVSMINQVLASRTEASQLIENRSLDLQKTIYEIEGISAQTINQIVENKTAIEKLADRSGSEALDLANSCEMMEASLEDVNQIISVSHKGGAIAQEASWKMGSIRENTQSMAKRIKRLGENTQSITVSSETIKEMSRRVKILALNLALEAAEHGEVGRVFTSLAKELDRLAQNTDQSVKDIESQINTIQTDAQETVVAMETGIVDVVEIAKLTAESIGTFKEQDRLLDKTKNDFVKVLKDSQKSALSISSEGENAKDVAVKMSNIEEDLRNLRVRSAGVQGVLASFRNWLRSIGRDL